MSVSQMSVGQIVFDGKAWSLQAASVLLENWLVLVLLTLQGLTYQCNDLKCIKQNIKILYKTRNMTLF
jgi:hypothetical protein